MPLGALDVEPMAGASNMGLVTRTKPKHRWIEDGDEPSNEELGIVPWTGWRIRLFWLAYFAAIGGAMLGYAWAAGVWPF